MRLTMIRVWCIWKSCVDILRYVFWLKSVLSLLFIYFQGTLCFDNLYCHLFLFVLQFRQRETLIWQSPPMLCFDFVSNSDYPDMIWMLTNLWYGCWPTYWVFVSLGNYYYKFIVPFVYSISLFTRYGMWNIQMVWSTYRQ